MALDIEFISKLSPALHKGNPGYNLSIWTTIEVLYLFYDWFFVRQAVNGEGTARK